MNLEVVSVSCYFKVQMSHFVVHEHHATHLHWDFRLEVGGVLKSWAIPKGPSMNPSDKRLAIQVEDHSLEYGSFEGVIPEGEFEPVGDVEEGIRKGSFSVRLFGKKLRGEFALFQIKKSKTGKEWLMVKRKVLESASGY